MSKRLGKDDDKYGTPLRGGQPQKNKEHDNGMLSSPQRRLILNSLSVHQQLQLDSQRQPRIDLFDNRNIPFDHQQLLREVQSTERRIIEQHQRRLQQMQEHFEGSSSALQCHETNLFFDTNQYGSPAQNVPSVNMLDLLKQRSGTQQQVTSHEQQEQAMQAQFFFERERRQQIQQLQQLRRGDPLPKVPTMSVAKSFNSPSQKSLQKQRIAPIDLYSLENDQKQNDKVASKDRQKSYTNAPDKDRKSEGIKKPPSQTTKDSDSNHSLSKPFASAHKMVQKHVSKKEQKRRDKIQSKVKADGKNSSKQNTLLSDEKLDDNLNASSKVSLLRDEMPETNIHYENEATTIGALLLKKESKRRKKIKQKKSLQRSMKEKEEHILPENNEKIDNSETINGAEIMMSFLSSNVNDLNSVVDKSQTISNKKRKLEQSHQLKKSSSSLVRKPNDRLHMLTVNLERANFDANSLNSPSNGTVAIDYTAALPKLPVEPEYDPRLDEKINQGHGVSANGFHQSLNLSMIPTKVNEPTFILHQPSPENISIENSVLVDRWWPSNMAIKRERQRYEKSDDNKSDSDHYSCDGSNSKKKTGSVSKEKKENMYQTGVLEKLPRCKIHNMRRKRNEDGTDIEPMFCFQVTELYPNCAMVCCSICFTWRHACCGGHHDYPDSRPDRDDKPFIPICDHCFKEKELFSENEKLCKVIDKQRRRHLRRTLNINQVMRQAAYSKHGGTFKWPLGSVSTTHIGGHTKSVHSRHERSEKQWNDMAMKLRSGMAYRPRERTKIRTRELERLLTHVEDAEFITDQHNMLLFLKRDTSKERPAGYEIQHRNIFDPADDIDDDSSQSSEEDDITDDSVSTYNSDEFNDDHSASSNQSTASVEIVQASERDKKEDSDKHENELNEDDDLSTNISKSITDKQKKSEFTKDVDVKIKSKVESGFENGNTDNPENPVPSSSTDGSDDASDFKSTASAETNKSKSSSPSQPCCASPGCDMAPRYDSLFCSDACGVCALELDLMRSFEYARFMHPSLLRL